MSQGTIASAVFVGVHLKADSVHTVAVSEQGDMIADASAPYQHRANAQPLPKGYAEENPEMWWDATKMALGYLVTQLRSKIAGPSQLKAVSVCCQPGSIVALNRAGVPVLPAILAKDDRGAEYVKSLNFHGREHGEKNGVIFHATDPIAKIAWVKDNLPDLYEDAVFVHQADFIVGRLKGVPDITEYSFAVRTGCDVIDENWPDWLDYDMYLSVRERLPGLSHFGTKVGEITPKAAAATGLPAGAAVVLGTTSSVAGFIASGARKVGDFHTVLDKHLTINGIAPKMVRSQMNQIISHKLPNRLWSFSVESKTGTEWIDQWFPGVSFDTMTQSAASVLPTSYLAYPNVSKGETFPFLSTSAGGFIAPATDDRTVQFASCLQGTALFEKYCYRRLDVLAGTTETPGDIYTGAEWAANDFWMQCRADVMGRTNRRMKGHGGIAYGAAMIAALGSTFHSIEELADAMLTVDETFFPNPEMNAKYTERFQKFCTLMEEQGYGTAEKGKK